MYIYKTIRKNSKLFQSCANLIFFQDFCYFVNFESKYCDNNKNTLKEIKKLHVDKSNMIVVKCLKLQLWNTRERERERESSVDSTFDIRMNELRD